MKIGDERIATTLEYGGYIRRKSWREGKAVYRMNDDETMEFGYMTDDGFVQPKSEEDRWCIGYDDIVADDWEVLKPWWK